MLLVARPLTRMRPGPGLQSKTSTRNLMLLVARPLTDVTSSPAADSDAAGTVPPVKDEH
jgi:hypothetical protein